MTIHPGRGGVNSRRPVALPGWRRSLRHRGPIDAAQFATGAGWGSDTTRVLANPAHGPAARRGQIVRDAADVLAVASDPAGTSAASPIGSSPSGARAFDDLAPSNPARETTHQTPVPTRAVVVTIMAVK
jgi:hypothetical protein